MTGRAHISLKTKLASALLALGDIPYDDAKQMTAEQIISLYNFDHGILHGIVVNDNFWNLTPRLIVPHRQKSKIDTGIVAGVKRLESGQRQFDEYIRTKSCGQKREPRGKIRGRGFEKGRKFR